MVASTSTLRIGIYGLEEDTQATIRGCALWDVGYASAVGAAGAMPISLGESVRRRSWNDALGDVHGLVWTGKPSENGLASTEEDRLCHWCRKNNFPLLAIDNAMHAL